MLSALCDCLKRYRACLCVCSCNLACPRAVSSHFPLVFQQIPYLIRNTTTNPAGSVCVFLSRCGAQPALSQTQVQTSCSIASHKYSEHHSIHCAPIRKNVEFNLIFHCLLECLPRLCDGHVQNLHLSQVMEYSIRMILE